MKYYIPTSTLNVSNILSSGSISPYSYYGKRQFGIKTFEPIKECEKFKDQIILFKKYPLFSIISDKESYPMCIEIEIPDNMVAQSNIPDICYACETIYISPKNVFFVFNSEEDLKKSLFWIEISDEAKFFDQYKDKFVLSDDKKDTFDLTTSTLKNLIIEKTPDIEKEVLKDWKIDKIRGSLCGMFVGTNGFDGGDKTGVGYRRNKIKELISQLLYIFDGHDKLVSQTCLLQKSALSEFEKKEQSIYQLCSIQTDGRLDILYNEDNEVRVEFYNKLLNRILVNSETLTQQEVSQEGGKLLSTLYGNRWKGSPDYNYLIQLYNNVTRYDNFELNTNGSIILRSFSAFVQRGLGEWDKLRDYLNERNDTLPDRRFVYGLYGALNGFSTLSKTLTDTTDISDNAITDFINDINEESLIDVDIAFIEKGLEDGVKEEATVAIPVNDLCNRIPEIVTLHPEEQALKDWQNEIRVFAASIIKRDRQKLLNSLEEALSQNGNNQDYFVFITMLDNFEGWKPGKNGPSTTWKRLQEHYVPDYEQRMGKPSKKQSPTKKNVQQEKDLFDGIMDGLQNVAQSVRNAFAGESESRKGKSILDDKAWIYECASLISDSRAKKQFIEDMEWFVGNHNDTYKDKKKGVIKGYYAGHDRTNERVLERIRAYLDNKVKPRNNNMQWLADIYVNIPTNQIVDYISKVYGI